MQTINNIEVEEAVAVEDQTEDQVGEHQRPIVWKHHDMYEELKKEIAMIFPIKMIDGITNKANFLRCDSTVWGKEVHDFVVVPGIIEKFERVCDLAKKVSQFHFFGNWAHTDDSDELASWKKMYQELTMILYRHAKIHKKNNNSIPIALLTPGTVVEYSVTISSWRGDGPLHRTVKEIREPDLGCALVITEEQVLGITTNYEGSPRWNFPKSEDDMFNSRHIKKIIKHVPGPLKITHHRDVSPLQNHQKYGAQSYIGKAKSAYCYTDSRFLVISYLGEQTNVLKDYDQTINIERFSNFVNWKAGVKLIRTEHSAYYSTLLINKKKFKRFIRQNMNRFLVSKKEQIRMDEAEQERQSAEYDRDYDNDY